VGFVRTYDGSGPGDDESESLRSRSVLAEEQNPKVRMDCFAESATEAKHIVP
jgi:hypothetical protein